MSKDRDKPGLTSETTLKADEPIVDLHLFNLTRAISNTIKLDELLKLFSSEIEELEGLDGHIIYFTNEHKTELVCEFGRLPSPFEVIFPHLLHHSMPLKGNDPNCDVYLNCQPARFKHTDMQSYTGITRDQFVTWKLNDLYIIPLTAEGISFGTLVLMSRTTELPEATINRVEALLSPFIRPFINAIDYAHMVIMATESRQDVRYHQRYLDFLNQANQLDTPAEIMKRFATELLNQFGFQFVSALMSEPQGLRMTYHQAAPGTEKGLEERWQERFGEDVYPPVSTEGLASHVFISNETVYIPDFRNLKKIQPSPKDKDATTLLGDCRSVIQIPIRKGQQPIGVIGMFSIGKKLSLTKSEIRFIESICELMGTSISNAQLFNEVQDQKAEIEKLNEKLTESNRELAEAKEAAEKNALIKSLLIATTSHEFRTPLHGILSFSQLGSRRTGKIPVEKSVYYFDRITHSGRRLLRLVNNILDMSKFESGTMDLLMNPHNIKGTITMAIEELGAYAADHNVSINFFEMSHPETLFIDQDRIIQVVYNLIANAIKHTPSGSSIDVTLMCGEEIIDGSNRSGAVITVRDHGNGIPDDELDYIFDYYFQSCQCSDTKAKGFGLGLAICREITHSHQGDIRADNHPDGGAIFSIFLPESDKLI